MMNNTFYLEPCPICGRKPKVHIERYPSSGTYVTIECRPFWIRTHLSVSRGRALEHNAVESAVDLWNSQAKAYRSGNPDGYHFMLKNDGEDTKILK